jgi:hypothetical protein
MLVARLVSVLLWILGARSLVLFFTFLWTEHLGIGLRFTNRLLLVWDTSLCVLFFLQHSILISRSVRAALKKSIREYCQGVAYTFASALVLLTLMLLWQHSAVALFPLWAMYPGLLKVLPSSTVTI